MPWMNKVVNWRFCITTFVNQKIIVRKFCRQEERKCETMFFKMKSYLSEKSASGNILIPGHYNTINDEHSSTSENIAQQMDPVTFSPFLGLFYIGLHAIFNQLASVIIKKFPYINPCQLSLIRNTGIFVATLPLTFYHTGEVFGERKDRLLLLLRGFFGSTGFYLQIMAYSYLPLAEASIIMSTLPVTTTVIARIVLKESYGLAQSLSLVITICGVLLAIRIPELLCNRNGVNFDSTYVTGLAASVGNVALLALSFVYIRKIKQVHFSVVMIYLGLVGVIENAVLNGIFIPFTPPECGWDQILCILLAAFYFVSNCFLTLALQLQPAGLVTVEKSSFDILTITAFQIIFFSVYPDVYVICGACLVMVSLIILGIRNGIVMKTSQVREEHQSSI